MTVQSRKLIHPSGQIEVVNIEIPIKDLSLLYTLIDTKQIQYVRTPRGQYLVCEDGRQLGKPFNNVASLRAGCELVGRVLEIQKGDMR